MSLKEKADKFIAMPVVHFNSELKVLIDRISELEGAIKKAEPILREKAWHLNMEWYTASGKVLGELADEFKQLI